MTMASKKDLFILLTVSITLVSCNVSKQNIITVSFPEDRVVKHTTVADITEDDIHWHISFLASDSMQGRATNTPYEAKAAQYIKEQFQSLGLKAFNDNYLQPVPVYSRTKFTECELYFNGYKGKFPEDFRSMVMFDSLTVAGEVIFAGYGYDSDYGNTDVRDKWVLIAEDDNSILYERKATARDKGASGLLVIGKYGTSGDERYVLPVDSMPMIRISHDLAGHLFSHAGTTVQDVLEKLYKGENNSISIPVVVNASVKSATQWIMSQNVVGYLETADSENENGYIVIGAHYDHVGTKKIDDSVEIFNGADDNASGVAGILEIAEKLQAGEKLKYNVIFAAFGAEEMGLLGSREFCNNPPVPLEKIMLMVNLDMIGRMDSSNHVFINTVDATDRFNPVSDVVKVLHPDLNIAFALDSYLQGSDHTSFFNKKIPAIFFTTGTHKDYHKSTDTPDSINYRGTKQLLDFVYDFVISPAIDNCIRSLTSSEVSP